MSKIAISVIVPIYNAEAYLQSCLDSLRSQSFSDFEVWLIDDGSKDCSGKICDDFARVDPRFHVIHKPNGGVSSARNRGLEQANGECICFVDADDVLTAHYLKDLYKATVGEEYAILVLQGFLTIQANGERIHREFKNKSYTINTIKYAFDDINMNRCGFPFAKLYNHMIIDQYQIRFIQDIHYWEDKMFLWEYLCHINKIKTIDGMNYLYNTININSLSNRISTVESEYKCYLTYFTLTRKLQELYQLTDNTMRNINNTISENLVRRAIGAMYQHQTRIRYSDRLIFLKNISQEQISFLQTYYKECNWFHKVTVYLLSKHYYYLCDLLNEGIAIGRFIKTEIRKKISLICH